MSNFKGINGTPWHVEAIGMDEDDERRHRSRCVYFQKDSVFCHKRKGKCIGSAHCDYYKEKPREVEPAHKEIVLKDKSKQNKYDIHKDWTDQTRQIGLFVGGRITHYLFGDGKILSIGNGYISVAFDDGSTRKFSVKDCVEKGFLKVISEDITDVTRVEPEIEHENEIDKTPLQENAEKTKEKANSDQNNMDISAEKTALSNLQTLLIFIILAVVTFAAGIGMHELINNQLIIKIGSIFMVIAPLILLLGVMHYIKVRRKLANWQNEEE